MGRAVVTVPVITMDPGGGQGHGSGNDGGRGYGMGGGGAFAALDLTDSQRKQIASVQDEVRKKNWTVMGSMHDERAKLRDAMWAGDKLDRTAVVAANKRMSELRQQMFGKFTRRCRQD